MSTFAEEAGSAAGTKELADFFRRARGLSRERGEQCKEQLCKRLAG